MLYSIAWSYNPNNGYFHDFCWTLEEVINYLKEVTSSEYKVKVVRVSEINSKSKEVKEILCLDFDR